MKRLLYRALLASALSLWGLGSISCNESEEAGEYDNWPARNQHYVDSIAALANAGTDGWTKILSYNFYEPEGSTGLDNNHYIYVQKLEEGTGTQSPEYNDSLRIHYMGRLIPTASYPQGYIFGKSYTAYALNETTDVPALMAVNSNIDGMATAEMHMVEGDRWKVVVPYFIGYGTAAQSNIPAYSTLIFDVKLARLYKYKTDTDTTWH